MLNSVKRFLGACLVLAVLGSSFSVSAESSSLIPLYESVHDTTVSISVSENGLAACCGQADVAQGETCKITMTLYKSRDKEAQSYVISWDENSNYIYETFYVLSGYYYRLTVEFYIYNSQNKLDETITDYSSWKKY